MKKILCTFGLAITAAVSLSSCASTSSSTTGTDNNSMIIMVVVYAAIFAAIYFFFLRPSNKKKKEEQSMRDNLQIGDEIVTIGGIMGKVVNVKEETDSFIMETGSDRVRLQFKTWALHTVVTRDGEPLLTEAEKKKQAKEKEKAEKEKNSAK